MPTLLTPKQQQTIKSMRLYWEEIAQRDDLNNTKKIANKELSLLLNHLPAMTVLLIIAQYSRAH